MVLFIRATGNFESDCYINPELDVDRYFREKFLCVLILGREIINTWTIALKH